MQKTSDDLWERLSRSPLFLDQTDAQLVLERGQVEEHYLPLAEALISRAGQVPRLLVAVAGPPGSGKSSLATILVAVINACTGSETSVLVGLDGWHYANDYLESHFIERDGHTISLRQIKGAPESFDAEAAYDCLAAAREGGEVSFPVYSRRLHEPMPDAGTIRASHRIVVMEGNYLLLDEPRWARFRDIFDVRLFISASHETLLEGLRERQLRGGKSPEAVEEWLLSVDVPNIERVLPGVARADVVVHKADVRNIARVQWRC
jgi:pantothenate kinase